MSSKQEVIDAVKEGIFSIYAISKVEEGLEFLTGMPAGELNEDGTYPEGTVNYLIMKRFEEISKALEKKKDKEKEDENQEKKDGGNGDK